MSAGMSCAIEGEGVRCLNCEAYRAGRAAGYEEARPRNGMTDVACSLCGCKRLACSFGAPTACSGVNCPDPLHDVMREQSWSDIVAEQNVQAHAAGYAEAVATIVVDLRRQSEGLDLTSEKKLSRYVGGLASRYATGAHVGAAKKGGG